ncbi:TPA: hypothetical protein LVN30_003079 [Klebsiella oxytoca]|nr:hypothetical protein [Klebsiella oxytoca]
MPLPCELRSITQQPLVNDGTYGFTLGLQAINDRIPVNYHHSDYQLNNRPADFSCNKRCSVFQ